MSEQQDDTKVTNQQNSGASASAASATSTGSSAASASASSNNSSENTEANSGPFGDVETANDVASGTEGKAPIEGEVERAEKKAEQSAEDLAKLLATAQKKADEHQDQMMRAHAEMENLKRRHAQELEKAHKYALDKFVNELLGVWDSLELGNAAAQDESADVAKLREGTELTLKMLSDVMQKFGVEQHNPEGETFNPEHHQAMSMQPRSDVAPNTVIGVVQKGYSLNGRLVRPAMVMVSQAA